MHKQRPTDPGMSSSHRMHVSNNVGENRRCRRLPERRGERNAREETEEEGDATPPTCHVRPADKQIRHFDRNQPTRSGVTGMTGISTKVQLLRCLFSRRRFFLFFFAACHSCASPNLLFPLPKTATRNNNEGTRERDFLVAMPDCSTAAFRFCVFLSAF